jgi:glycerol kinase
VWASTAEITANWRLDATFEPSVDASTLEGRHAAWARAVERSRAWAGD